jgi:putative NADPH-quinone reductase
MKVMTVLAHPDEGGFNHAIAESVKGSLRERGYEIPKDGSIDP